jgi:hypothetical protein
MRRFLMIVAASVAAFPLALAPTSAEAGTPTLQMNKWVKGKVASGSTGATYKFTPTTSGYYLVTLGDLTADYSLTIRNPDGSVKAASDRRTVGAFEERAVRLSAGKRYRIRVGSKKVSGTYALRALKLKAGVRTIDVTRVRSYDPNGASDVTMRVFNNTSKYQEIEHDPLLVYRNAAGREMTAAPMSHAVKQILAPHTMGYIHEYNTPTGWKSVRIVHDLEASPTAERPGKPSWVKVTTKSTGREQWDVKVKNTTTKRLTGYVNFVYFDKRGRLVNVADNNMQGTAGIFTVYGGNVTDATVLKTNQPTTAPVSLRQRLVYIEP